MKGEKITFSDSNEIRVPERPIIPYIEGDGTGPDIWAASQRVFDAAVKKVYKGERTIVWKKLLAGETAFKETGNWLPDETVEIIKEHCVAIKGPLTTPIGGGFRSLNVTLRKILDLYACVRPVRYFDGVPSPMKHPELVNMVIFRENTEDVYAGFEWKSGTAEANKLIEFLNKEMNCKIRENSGVGIKPMSPFGTKRLVRRAIKYALENKRESVTLVHKGNIMKYTEGAFREWGYEVAKEEFGNYIVTEDEVTKVYGGKAPLGKLIIKDRIADSMFQQALLRPSEYAVLAVPNLNGDYLSDAISAQVGGLGIGPGANIGDRAAVFEATHGTAPKYAGQDKVNPSSVILSGVMMFEYIGWKEVADTITNAVAKTIKQKIVTYDFARLLEGARQVRCSQFGNAVIENL